MNSFDTIIQTRSLKMFIFQIRHASCITLFIKRINFASDEGRMNGAVCGDCQIVEKSFNTINRVLYSFLQFDGVNFTPTDLIYGKGIFIVSIV